MSGSALAVGWLRAIHLLARPVLGVPPDVLTACGVLSALAAIWLTALGGDALWAALAAIVATGVFDGLDGAVALRTGRARPLGAVLDAASDRLTELCFVAVLLVLGAPAAWCAAMAAALLLHEYVRARAQVAGMRGAGAITVSERPTRLVVTAVAVTGAALAPAGTPWTGWPWGTTCAVVGTGLSLIGLAHLGVGVALALGRNGRAGRDSG
ncbi:CDP-diacylglycerol--glycerol-3-phosphate 3-phosphatidyltransferase [Amycolatopsis rifamycinica]|uniref:CDP-diacylglycerol--glycerol-3-phosphate 3-phosphatidyltransferase n=1 Tax=Amycolatopsis rifamycinica TaxID=287986 RepID=A0A066TUL7_9PSEU|nr:CDP-diacylglycerol--glycerol-3-phosphate 3-phosphatidyltransferase [Amycolatopsis rifamycinica]